MKPLLVFDLDGTLIDSAQDIAESLNRTLNKYGKNAVPFETVVAHIGEGLRKLLEDFFPEYVNNEARKKGLELEFLEHYEQEMLNRTTVFPGVEKFLERYDGPIGIITNKNEAPAKILLKHFNLDRFPWVEVFGADSLPEKKPSPLPLMTMMGLAKKSARETIMIGDGTPDIISARRAGAGALAVSFGYTEISILQGLGAHSTLAHYDLLEDLVQKWDWNR